MLQAHKHCSPESFCLTGRFFTYNFVVVMAATISTSTLGLPGTLEKTSSRASLKSSTFLIFGFLTFLERSFKSFGRIS